MTMSSDAVSTPTVSEPAHADAGHAHDDHKPDIFYVKVALALAVVTAAEVTLSYLDLGALFKPLLLILMVSKFVAVVSFFMHLKWDSKVFSWLFYAPLFLAIGVYLAALLAFQFFGS